MRYVILAILVVVAIGAALLWLPEQWGQVAAVVDDGSSQAQGEFVDLAPPTEPDYTTVVTDEALAQELKTEAEAYLAELDQSATSHSEIVNDGAPLLMSSAQSLSSVGMEGSVQEWLARYGITTRKNDWYFVHRVSNEDKQGVWGIVQGALIARFADGIALRRGDNQKTYQLLIPQHADEREADGTSSFLGKVIWHKTQRAQVINTERGWSRQSVELLIPGEDVVVVSFAHDELVAVYQYFATASR